MARRANPASPRLGRHIRSAPSPTGRERWLATMIGGSFDRLANALHQQHTPYPWCYGAPTKAACIEAGYCRREPTCGD